MTIEDSSIASLVDVEINDEDGVRWLNIKIDGTNIDAAALMLTRGIVGRRLGVNQRIQQIWLDVFAGGTETEPSASDKRILESMLLTNIGTPSVPAYPDHLHGFVAEQLFFELVKEIDAGLGVPITFESHDYSATDPGGDGLAIHSVDGSYMFRLWESKYHGSSDPVKGTVSKASKQLRTRATSYLSRFGAVAQRMQIDTELAIFYGRLTELWVNNDSAAGVGITVSASTNPPAGNPFSMMPGDFDLQSGSYQGQLSTTDDFEEFAAKVQALIWKGC